MIKQDRRPYLSPVLRDHHPATHGETCGPVSRLSGQAEARGELFFPSSAVSQALIESSYGWYVIIYGETNVHDYDSSEKCLEFRLMVFEKMAQPHSIAVVAFIFQRPSGGTPNTLPLFQGVAPRHEGSCVSCLDLMPVP
jgi:hypothetical protein